TCRPATLVDAARRVGGVERARPTTDRPTVFVAAPTRSPFSYPGHVHLLQILKCTRNLRRGCNGSLARSDHVRQMLEPLATTLIVGASQRAPGVLLRNGQRRVQGRGVPGSLQESARQLLLRAGRQLVAFTRETAQLR